MSTTTERSMQDAKAQALMHVRALVAFAYENGFHELGYDPVEVLIQEGKATTSPEANQEVDIPPDLFDAYDNAKREGFEAYKGSFWPMDAIMHLEKLRRDIIQTVTRAAISAQAQSGEATDDEVVRAHNLGFASGVEKGRRETLEQAGTVVAEWVNEEQGFQYLVPGRLPEGTQLYAIKPGEQAN